MDQFLQVQNVSMTFADKGREFHALDQISLTVRKGEFVTLIGHSGCGKSTLLNLVAGLIVPSAGRIVCGGKEIAGPGPDRGVVFQNHSLLPWMTCRENIMLGVKQVFGKTKPASELRSKVDAALAMVHLDHAANKYPYEISGGMKQRVGIARALAIEPEILLLDEPFGALDALTRASLQDELIRIVNETHSTVVMVTHDPRASAYADRVVFLADGLICGHLEFDGNNDLAQRSRLTMEAMEQFTQK